MTADTPPARPRAPCDALPETDGGARRAAGRIAELRALLRVASVLAREGRAIELSGLEEGVGRLCAGVLDLPPGDGRALRPDLARLLGDLDALATLLRSQPPSG